MGRPIVYCADCGRSLTETEFDQGRAHFVDNRPWCTTCRPIAPDRVPEPALSTATPRRPIAAKTARVPVAKPPASKSLALWLGGGGAALLLAVAIAVLSAPARPPPESPPPPAPDPKPVARNADAGRKLEIERARADQAKLDGFLAEIRKILSADDLVKRKGEVESMLKSASEVAGGRRREVDDLKSEFARRLLQAELRAALVGHWPFDATLGGSAADASGRNQTGRLEQGPQWVDAQVGGGLRFDGKDDYLELPNSPTLDRLQLASFTLAAWFRPEREPPGKDKANNAAFGILIKEGSHEGLHYANGARFAMSHYLAGNKGAGVSADPGRHPPGRFYHVAGTVDRDAGQTRLYVDGKLEKSATFAAKTVGRDFKAAKWRIGIGKPAAKEYAWPADGVIDDVRIYDRTLTDGEIVFLSEEGRAGRAP